MKPILAVPFALSTLALFVLTAPCPAQWDYIEDFNDGLPDGWSLPNWSWVEHGEIYDTPYVHSLNNDYQYMVTTPIGISDPEFLVVQVHYYVKGNDGDAGFQYAFNPNGPWYSLLAILSPWSIVQGICTKTLSQGEIAGDQLYLRFAGFLSPDGGIREIAIDDLRVSTQFPGWIFLDVQGLNSDVPAAGGPISFNVDITSTLPMPLPNLTYQVFIQTPSNHSIYGPRLGPFHVMTISLQPFQTHEINSMVMYVPGFGPWGNYNVYVFIGYPFLPSFQTMDWTRAYKWSHAANATNTELRNRLDDGMLEAARPPLNPILQTQRSEAFEPVNIYPNPFNNNTTITLTLPTAAELNLTVHGLLGRTVAELAHGVYPSGQHSFTFDGSSLASGVYFVHASVPGELNQVRKIVRMK